MYGVLYLQDFVILISKFISNVYKTLKLVIYFSCDGVPLK
jgi:hypothetical protein